jgi:serine protease Do
MHRGITGVGAYDRYLQTDASINMGNSGGPMFDMSGNVIGVNSALISPTGASVGIGLAIPAELAKPVIDSLRRGERPQRGYLGVGLQPLDENIAAALGLPKDRGELVRSVVEGQAAARAGIRQGDVIVRVNGKDVTPDETVSFLIANTPVNSRVPVEIIRQGRRQTVTVQVAQRPTEEQLAQQVGGANDNEGTTGGNQSGQSAQALGMTLQSLTPDLVRRGNLPAGTRGVLIVNVDPASAVAEEGVRPGFVIVSIDQQPVTSPAEVSAAVEAAKRAGRKTVLLLVRSGNNPEAFVGIDITR